MSFARRINALHTSRGEEAERLIRQYWHLVEEVHECKRKSRIASLEVKIAGPDIQRSNVKPRGAS
jgi:hypothetical protein